MKRTFLILLLGGFMLSYASAQQATIIGHVYDATNKDPLSFATVGLEDGSTGVTTDSAGYFEMLVTPGLLNLQASYTGYQSVIQYEVRASTAKPVYLDFFLEPSTTNLETVEVKAASYQRSAESPLSIQRITVNELERMPGATLDVSRFIKTLPGVSPRTSFGYNMIVRGGSSNENKFFLDGVEIPAITHFTVQGTSGGPNGILNVRMLSGADLHSGAFPAARPDALSSVTEVYQREGRRDRWGGNFTLGATDFGFMAEGPIGKKASIIVSARESYSQHMFKAIGLPVLPFYSDVQLKSVIHFDEKNELTLIGLGGFDRYTLNLEAEASESILYNTGYIPEGTQLLYTAGAVYKHYLDNGYYTAVLSRNYFDNRAEKFLDNTYEVEDQVLDFASVEAEDHLRLEHKIFGSEGTEWNYGVNFERNQVTNDNFSIYTFPDGSLDTLNFNSEIGLIRYGAFGSYSRLFADGKLRLFAGLRIDGNTYSAQMQNPLRQLSPRLSARWTFADGWHLNGSAGIYYQLPPYLLMSFQSEGELVNQDRLDYMRSRQAALGVEHVTNKGYNIKLEGFYKLYDNYPFLLLDSISYANANASYALLGNQPADMSSEGRAYGIEFQVKQKLRNTYYWMLTYSFVVSQFKDTQGNYVSSSWDNRHFGTLAVGKTFRNNWDVGFRFSFSGGNPYTPYDIELSSQRAIWDLNRRGLADFDQLNEARLPLFHQLDFRVDKQWNFRKWALTAFVDIQNIYSSSVLLLPYLTVEYDAENNPIVDPNDDSRYLTRLISSDTGRVLPSLGILVDL